MKTIQETEKEFRKTRWYGILKEAFGDNFPQADVDEDSSQDGGKLEVRDGIIQGS
jgi:hypothetical protein